MQKFKSKADLISSFRQSEKDTGSIELQIALITNRINNLTAHFKANPKDFGSKRGLLMLVGQRRSFLKYIENNNNDKYKELIERLELRK